MKKSLNTTFHKASVNKQKQNKLKGHNSIVIWFTGISGSGKSTLALSVAMELYKKNCHVTVLDGDNVRHGLCNDLGFTKKDRVENIRRTAEVAKLMQEAGLVVITAFISPFRSERDMARSLFDKNEFVEVFLDVSLETAEARDPKGLYRKARQGELPHFTGIDSPYEAPETAELILDTATLSVEQCVDLLMAQI